MLTHPRIFAALALAVALSSILGAASSRALASTLPTDRVGGRPISSSATLEREAPDVSMAAGALLTMGGRELWDRAVTQRRAMASITKIMTAVVVLENSKLNDEVTVDKAAVGVGESDAGIRAGDTLTVAELLEAMLVKSGNEAAFALAEHTGGSVPTFVEMMNAKAVSLGLKDTHFANPHGLDAPDHYTTAADLAVLTRYAMADSVFRTTVGKDTITLTGAAGTRTLHSTDLLLGTYPGAEGVKTGWTDGAGHSIVSAAKRGAVELVAVVLGTQSDPARFAAARLLLDWGFAHYASKRLGTKGTPAGSIPVSDYLDRAVPAVVAVTTSTPVFDLEGPVTKRLRLVKTASAPVRAGQLLGVVIATQGSRVLGRVPVVAAAAVPAPGAWEAFTIWMARLWRGVFGGQGVAAPVAAPAMP